MQEQMKQSEEMKKEKTLQMDGRKNSEAIWRVSGADTTWIQGLRAGVWCRTLGVRGSGREHVGNLTSLSECLRSAMDNKQC